jgi:hypothetical protein
MPGEPDAGNKCDGVVCSGLATDCLEAAACDPDTGLCVARPKAPGLACTDDGNPCTLDACDGAGACAHPAGNAGTVCRAAAGPCDVAETCSGDDPSCPVDAFAGIDVECRAAADVCDVAENCSGASADCPADTFAAMTTVCRPATGACDVAESCTGSAAECPADAFAGGSVVCRPAAGVCDVAESCTGSAADCPADAFLGSDVVCRPAASGCDQAESCTGSAAACPTDVTNTCSVCGHKFYDANADGVFGDDEQGIAGWHIDVDGAGGTHSGSTDGSGTYHISGLAAGDYTVCEADPTQASWRQTAPASTCYSIHLPSASTDCTLDFGNLCLGGGGSQGLGFWTNKNGEKVFQASDSGAGALALLDGLNLRNPDGSDFDPTTYAQVSAWLIEGNSPNIAYMLSVQLAAAELNVHFGLVSGGSVVYAPGASSANEDGYVTIDALLAETNTELGSHGLVTASSPYRSYQAALESALDNANGNTSFVRSGPCTFTF